MNRNGIKDWLHQTLNDSAIKPKGRIFIASLCPSGKFAISGIDLLFDDPDQIEKYLDQQGHEDYTLIVDDIPRPE